MELQNQIIKQDKDSSLTKNKKSLNLFLQLSTTMELKVDLEWGNLLIKLMTKDKGGLMKASSKKCIEKIKFLVKNNFFKI